MCPITFLDVIKIQSLMEKKKKWTLTKQRKQECSQSARWKQRQKKKAAFYFTYVEVRQFRISG